MNFFPYLLNGLPFFGSVVSGGIFLGGNGAVGAPTFSFTSQSTTGMYLRAAGQLSFAAAGLRGLTVDGNAFTLIADFAFLAPAGTVGAPTLAGPGQTAGLYFPTATSIGISTNGILAATIDAAQVFTFANGIKIPGGLSAILTTTTAITTGAAAAAGTLLNAPIAGNPTKWAPVNDNGTVRYVPMW